MTTRGTQRLDRLITLRLPVTRTENLPATKHRYDRFPGFGSQRAGEYTIFGMGLYLFGPSQDGLDLPAASNFPQGSNVRIEWTDGGLRSQDFTLASDARSVDDFGVGNAAWLELRAVDALDFIGQDQINLVVAGGLTTVTEIQDVRVWASRQDVSLRDQLDLDQDQRLIVHLSRFTIRARAGVAVDQEMVDDMGQGRRIIGKEYQGRNRFVVLLAEAIT